LQCFLQCCFHRSTNYSFGRYGNPNATDDQIEKALEESGSSDFVHALKDGLATELSTSAGGSGLSIGQKQRLAIARAFLRPSPILLLDEPTAALDAKSEELVNAAILKLIVGKTAIMITHRMTSVRFSLLSCSFHLRLLIHIIRNADNIVICQGGLCTEQGSPDELLNPARATPSIFSSFISQHTAAAAKMSEPAATAAPPITSSVERYLTQQL